MNTRKLSILLCTNGYPETRPAMEMGVHLVGRLQQAGQLSGPVRLLGVQEKRSSSKNLEALLAETEASLQEAGVPVKIQREQGDAPEIIERTASSLDDHLTVFGPLGRPAWRQMVYGRTFRHILANIASPILFVPEVCWPVQRMLICMGGLAYTLETEHLSLHLARLLAASVTILHVVEPVTLEYRTSRQIHDHWRDILSTDTPQGNNLRQAMADFEQAGIEARFLARHGNIVHELTSEIKSGGYDLVAMGSSYSSHNLRHLYLPNVTAEVAETARRPILSVRSGKESASGSES